MSSTKLLTVLFIVCALGYCALATENDDWNDYANAIQNGPNEDATPELFDFFLSRQLANNFGQIEDQEEYYKRLFSSSKDKGKATTEPTTTTKKPKYDAEEVWEIEAKTNARRKKAYKNYEDACKVSGKFTVRTCPKIEDCFAKNKLKFIPVQDKPKPTPKPGRREFIERELALSYLEGEESDQSDIDDDDDDDDFIKRMLFSKNASKELQEETKERKQKAFKKYEEYCEKRKFRIGAQRNCPPLKADLC